MLPFLCTSFTSPRDLGYKLQSFHLSPLSWPNLSNPYSSCTYKINTTLRRILLILIHCFRPILYIDSRRTSWKCHHPLRILGQRAMTPRPSACCINLEDIHPVVFHESTRSFESLLDNCPLSNPLAWAGQLCKQVSSGILDGRGPSTSPHASPPKGRFGPTIELWPRGSKKTFFYIIKCHKL